MGPISLDRWVDAATSQDRESKRKSRLGGGGTYEFILSRCSISKLKYHIPCTALCTIFQIQTTLYNPVIIPTLQMRKLRLRDVKSLPNITQLVSGRARI